MPTDYRPTLSDFLCLGLPGFVLMVSAWRNNEPGANVAVALLVLIIAIRLGVVAYGYLRAKREFPSKD